MCLLVSCQHLLGRNVARKQDRQVGNSPERNLTRKARSSCNRGQPMMAIDDIGLAVDFSTSIGCSPHRLVPCCELRLDLAFSSNQEGSSVRSQSRISSTAAIEPLPGAGGPGFRGIAIIIPQRGGALTPAHPAGNNTTPKMSTPAPCHQFHSHKWQAIFAILSDASCLGFSKFSRMWRHVFNVPIQHVKNVLPQCAAGCQGCQPPNVTGSQAGIYNTFSRHAGSFDCNLAPTEIP